MSVEKLFNEMHSKHLLTEIHLRYFVDCVCRVCVRVRIIHRLTLFYVARYFVNYIEIYNSVIRTIRNQSTNNNSYRRQSSVLLVSVSHTKMH